MTSLSLTVKRTGFLHQALEVNLAFSGQAVNGIDYESIPNVVSFAAGEGTKTITVKAINDSVLEDDEEFGIKVAPSPDYQASYKEIPFEIYSDDRPVNDEFVNRIPLSGSLLTTTGSNLGATSTSTNDLTDSVWWSWVAPTTGPVRISTAGSDIYNYLGVFTGSTQASLTRIAYARSGRQNIVTIDAVAGTEYQIAVGGFFSQGSITLTIGSNILSIAVTDPDFSEKDFNSGTFTLTRNGGTNIPLTVKLNVSGTAIRGVDYTALPTTVTFAVGQSTLDLVVTPLQDIGVEVPETVIVTIASGPNYTAGAPDSATLTLEDGPPSNDHFANAILLTGPSFSSVGHNVDATIEPNEPSHGTPSGGHSVWYLWTAPTSGATQVRTHLIINERFENRKTAVYTGTSVDALTPVAMQSHEETFSSYFIAQQGTQYAIAIDSSNSANMGTVNVHVLHFPDQQLLTITADKTTFNESGGDAATLTFVRTGDLNVPLSMSLAVAGSATPGTDYTTIASSITIPIGATSATLTVQPIDDSELEFDETIEIIVSGSNYRLVSSNPFFRLTLRSEDRPVNDNFAQRIALQGANTTATGFNTLGTTEPGEPSHVVMGAGKTVWWSWTAPDNGVVELSTAGSSFNTALAVYRGDAINTLTAIAANDDQAAADLSSRVVFNATLGVEYIIAVDGVPSPSGEYGTVKLALNLTPSLPVVSLALNSVASVIENSGTSLAFRVSRSGSTAANLTVQYSISGSATSGDDFQALSGAITFPPGAAFADILVQPIDDNTFEPSKTIDVTLDTAATYQLGNSSTATGTIVSEDMLDLTAVNITAPAAVAHGATFTINWQTKNLTDKTAAVSIADAAYLSTDNVLDATDVLLGNTPLSGNIQPGQSIDRSLSFASNLTEGTYFILIKVDADSALPESDESNNVVAAGTIKIQAADLQVADIVAPLEIVTDIAFELKWTLTNQGNASAAGPWVDNVYLSADAVVGSDTLIAQFQFNGTLAPGASILRTQSILIPRATVNQGNFHFVVLTNSGAQVPEGTRGGNNSRINPSSTLLRVAPLAQNGSALTNEDNAVVIDFVATDINNENLSYIVVQPASRGTVTIAGSKATYTPAADYFGTDSFTFKASNGIVDSNTATIALTVQAVNDAPIASAGSLTTSEDAANAGTLTANDTEQNALQYSIVDHPTKGSVTITNTATGAYTYTPNLNANGSDSFTFKVNDGTVDSNTAMITVTITPVNDAPLATADSLTTLEDIAFSGTLTASDVDLNALIYSIVEMPAKGSVTITNTATGTYTYTPNLNANGSDTFTFEVNDGTADSNTATVIITITPVNDAPLANAGSFATLEDSGYFGMFTASDVDLDTLVYSIVEMPAKGSVKITNTATGTYIYSPNLNANGSDSFTFKVNDGTIDSDSATITVTITPVNDAPVALPQAVATLDSQTVSGFLQGLDLDGDTFTFKLVDNGTRGTLSLTNVSTGAFTYTPNGASTGSDSIIFVINDGTTDSAISTLNVTVNPTAAAVTSVLTAIGKVGVPFSYTITASGTAPVIFSTTVLPPGLSLNGSTISGTPTLHGLTSVELTASNAAASDKQILAIMIAPGKVEFISAPNATPNSAIVGQSVLFSTLANGVEPIIYTWSFGDGATDVGANVTHAYSPAKDYTVTVVATDAAFISESATFTITVNAVMGGTTGSGSGTLLGEMDSDGDGFSDILENAAGSDPLDVLKTPSGSSASSDKQSLSQSVMKLVAKRKTLTLSGMLHIPADFVSAGQIVVVNIGGFTQKFVLNAKDTSKTAKDSFKVSIKSNKGKVPEQDAKFKLLLNNVPDTVHTNSPLLIMIDRTIFSK